MAQRRDQDRVIDAMRVLEHRGLPEDRDMERLVLGMCLNDRDALELAYGAITDSCFADQWHRQCWAGIVELRDAGEPVDRVTLAKWLHGNGESDFSRVADLDQGMPQGVSIEGYVRRICDLDALRRAAAALNDALVQCLAPNAPRAALDAAIAISQAIAATKNGHGGLKSVREIVEAAGYDNFCNPHRDDRAFVPLPQKWRDLADLLPRIRIGSLTTIAARTSVGKSAYLADLALWTAAGQIPTAIFTMEMSGSEVIRDRMIANYTGLDSYAIQHGRLSAEERAQFAGGLADIESMPLQVCDDTGLSVAAMIGHVRRMRPYPRLVGIDYIQLMQAGKGENRTQEVSAITRGLKVAAGDLGVAIVALSQLRRTQDHDSEPQLSDLRESGSIEQDSNTVGFLHTKAEEFKRPVSAVEVLLKKNRGGRLGHVKMTFMKPQSRFIEEA